MKIIHCADLHLDSVMSSNFTEEQAEERRAELLLTFQNMIHYAKGNGITKIIIAGDLYDRTDLSVTAANVITDAIVKNPEIDFFYLKGNHDADVILRRLDPVPANLKLFTERWTRYSLTPKNSKNLKTITISGKEISGKTNGIETNTFSCPEMDPDKINIVVLHGLLSKSEIPLEKLQHKNIDYLALGHLHQFQKGTIDERGSWCYSGCLEGRGFDECGRHGFVLLDVDRISGKVSFDFIPFAGRCLYTLNVNVQGCRSTTDVFESVQKELAKRDLPSSSMVRIILEGRVSLDYELNRELLKKQLEGRFYFVKISDQTILEKDDRAYALDASLKGEFVRLTLAREDLDEKTKTEIIRYGIASLRGEW